MAEDYGFDTPVRLPRDIPRLTDIATLPRPLRARLRLLPTTTAPHAGACERPIDVWTVRAAVVVFGMVLVITLVAQALLALSDRPLSPELFLGLPPATFIVYLALRHLR
jgi:hypothetical protein